MGRTTTWDVYLKTQEMCRNADNETIGVSINSIAMDLAIDADIAEECAILLQKLGLVQFDLETKEIMLAAAR